MKKRGGRNKEEVKRREIKKGEKDRNNKKIELFVFSSYFNLSNFRKKTRTFFSFFNFLFIFFIPFCTPLFSYIKNRPGSYTKFRLELWDCSYEITITNKYGTWNTKKRITSVQEFFCDFLGWERKLHLPTNVFIETVQEVIHDYEFCDEIENNWKNRVVVEDLMPSLPTQTDFANYQQETRDIVRAIAESRRDKEEEDMWQAIELSVSRESLRSEKNSIQKEGDIERKDKEEAEIQQVIKPSVSRESSRTEKNSLQEERDFEQAILLKDQEAIEQAIKLSVSRESLRKEKLSLQEERDIERAIRLSTGRTEEISTQEERDIERAIRLSTDSKPSFQKSEKDIKEENIRKENKEKKVSFSDWKAWDPSPQPNFKQKQRVTFDFPEEIHSLDIQNEISLAPLRFPKKYGSFTGNHRAPSGIEPTTSQSENLSNSQVFGIFALIFFLLVFDTIIYHFQGD